MKTKLTFWAIAALFALQSCYSPRSLVKLEPAQNTSRWLYGQPFASDSLDGIIYEVAFDCLHENNYLFDFNITNRSNMPILIDPQTFYYLPLNDSMNAIVPNEIHALDPEKEILELEKELSRTEARRRNSVAMSIVAVGVDVATAAITATDDNPHNDFLRTDMFAAVQAGNVENSFHAQDLNTLRDSWSQSTIRKTTLDPNYSMKGKVFFPYHKDAKYVQMLFPVDDQILEIIFQQRLIPVY